MRAYRRFLLPAILGAACLTAGPAMAHHSYAAFNMETEATVTGTVKQIDWTNPHIWIWVDVPNDEGGTDTWGFEGMSPNFLERRGWTRSTLETGDEISVRFRPMKSGENGGMFLSTTHDGKVLSGSGANDER